MANLVNLFRESAGIPEPMPEHSYTSCRNNYRIVKATQGELVTGFHVQTERWVRSADAYVWRNIGRKVFSLEAARAQRDFFVQHLGKRAERSFEVIE